MKKHLELYPEDLELFSLSSKIPKEFIQKKIEEF